MGRRLPRDAELYLAADLVRSLVEVNAMAFKAELPCCRQPGGSAADDGDLVPGWLCFLRAPFRFNARLPISLIFKGLSTLPLLQLCMQRFGQICPQTVAGSGLYWSTSSSASAVFPCV